MKGPGFRLGLDVRRVWKCPACDRVRRTAGDVTGLRCHRSKCNHAWMRLVDPEHPWPTGLQIDLAAKIAEESEGDPEAGALAPRTASSVAEAIDTVTPPIAPPKPAAAPTPDEPAEATSEAIAETPNESPDPEASTSGPSASEPTEGEGAPKKKRRRGRRRGGRKKSGGGGSDAGSS